MIAFVYIMEGMIRDTMILIHEMDRKTEKPCE